MTVAQHIPAITTHARRGEISNVFRYSVDFVLIDPETCVGPTLFSRNALNLAAVHDRDHGGPIGAGRGVVWARQVLAERGLHPVKISLMTQPRFLGYQFNPVSFWLAERDGQLLAVIAEVNTPFGDRHSYVCHRDGFLPIRPKDQITAGKMMHVSPFQDVEGQYRFNFDIRSDQIRIRIAHLNADQGVIATLAGPRKPLTNTGMMLAFLRRPAGALRTISLIHWQALKLKLKGARYRARPEPAAHDIS